jgi:hypothetical protein
MNGEENLCSKLTKVSVSCSIVAKRRINLNEKPLCPKSACLPPPPTPPPLFVAADCVQFTSKPFQLRSRPIDQPGGARNALANTASLGYHSGSGKKRLFAAYFDLGSLRLGKDNFPSHKKNMF